MNEPKPFASLSSGLLARKGAAKPAMRPQGYGSFGSSLEDLGWDDMGHPAAPPVEHVPSSIAALTPAPGGRAHLEPVPSERELEEPEYAEQEFAEQEHIEADQSEPAVIGQQRALEASFEPEPQLEHEAEPEQVLEQEPEQALELEVEDIAPAEPIQRPAPVVALPRRKPALAPTPVRAAAAGAKAAFTLRLDADRHLRLRLACAVTRRSAQQIVTGALDEFLSAMPELEALAGHVPAAGRRAGQKQR